jgi:uncharacterized protein YndB with AHSA1/START domain
MTDPVATDTDVFITRSFAAPRAVVWKFWTDPARIIEWFGPTDFHVPVETVQIDLRVGGVWALAMADGENNRFPIRGTIVELVDEELIVVRLDADSGIGQLTDILLRVQFHDHGDRTRITLHQGPFSAEQRDLTAEGWELSFQKIDTILEGTSE